MLNLDEIMAVPKRFAGRPINERTCLDIKDYVMRMIHGQLFDDHVWVRIVPDMEKRDVHIELHAISEQGKKMLEDLNKDNRHESL